MNLGRCSEGTRELIPTDDASTEYMQLWTWWTSVATWPAVSNKSSLVLCFLGLSESETGAWVP